MRRTALMFMSAMTLSACSPVPQVEPEPEASSAAVVVEAPKPMPDTQAGERFLNALKAGDEALKPYGWREDASPAAKAHLQKLREMAQAQTLVAMEYARGGPIAMVIFYRPEDEGLIHNPQWRQDAYLKVMFVCNFEDSRGQWRFTDPLYCYSDDPSPFIR